MADRPLLEPLPADLPEDWTSGQIVAPDGAAVGLSEQHGYNYLMEQVNAVQRAANAINEGFDTISGKRTCRFVIGTSTAGWTQADCDYLCDGADDSEELKEAFTALMAQGGGEIVILSGEYRLAAVDFFFGGDAVGNVSIVGNPGATLLKLTGNFSVRGYSGRHCIRFSGIIFEAADSLPILTASGVSTDIQGCTFLNSAAMFTSVKSLGNTFRFENNLVEFDSDTYASNVRSILQVYDSQDGGCSGVCIAGNFFKISVPGAASRSNIIGVSTSIDAVVDGNTVICTAENWGIQCSGPVVLANNTVDGASFLLEPGSIAMTGNKVKNSSVVVTIFIETDGSHSGALSITGNQLANTTVFADGPIEISGNSFENEAGVTAITARKIANNADPKFAPIVVGNFFVGGSTGVHLSDSESATLEPEISHALICGNRILGCATAIRIDSNWSGCMVTDNLVDGSIVDNGSGNIIRLNSDDTGGGGGSAGVASFKGRTGIVTPQAGDYTAAMVGSRPDTWTPTAEEVGAVPAAAVTAIQSLTQAEYDALAVKNATTLYLIEG